MSSAPSWTTVNRICAVLALIFTALAVVYPKASVFTFVFLLITSFALPRLFSVEKKIWAILFTCAFVSHVFSFIQFVRTEAIFGMIEQHNKNASRSARSTLRHIIFAQDIMREQGFIDPDNDGIGSAGLLPELVGISPLPNGKTISAPLLHNKYKNAQPSNEGLVIDAEGYLFKVCLPTQQNKFASQRTQDIDYEKSERRFVAYAWPSEDRPGVHKAFYLDERERIYIFENESPRAYVGTQKQPSCDATLTGEGVDAIPPTDGSASNDGFIWQWWRNKQPRTTLVGDKS